MTYCIKCQKSDPQDKRPYGVMDWICGNCYRIEVLREAYRQPPNPNWERYAKNPNVMMRRNRNE